MSLSSKVRERLDIVDIIESEGILLKKEGDSRYSCLCPFHEEKTPSFKVDTNWQRYKCFGCGRSGDAIDFYAKMNCLEYNQAVVQLAEKLGIPLSEHDTDKYKEQKRLLSIAEELHRFYRKKFDELDITHPAKQEILKRGLKIEGYEEYFGYAPNSNTEVKDYLLSKGYTLEEIQSLGFVNEKGNIQLRNRLVFFIKDYMGNVIGFSGRTLEKDTKGWKYVNSKNSSLYNKSRSLYNISDAKAEAHKKQYIYLVEGPFDVIAMIQKGYKNTIAISGTAFTPEQSKLVRRSIGKNGRIIVCCDGDLAGQKSALNIFQKIPELQDALYLIILPDKQDPCEYLQEYDKLPKATKLIDFLFNSIKKKLPPTEVTNRKPFVDAVQEIITDYIDDSVLKEVYLKEACRLADVSRKNISTPEPTDVPVEPTKKATVATNTANNTNRWYKPPELDEEQKKMLKLMDSLSREDYLYIYSIAFYVLNRKRINRIHLLPENYPERYRSFIDDITNVFDGKMSMSQVRNKKLMDCVADIYANVEYNSELAESHYQTLLNLAETERKKVERAESKQKLKQLLEGLSNEEMLKEIERLEKRERR